MPTDFTVVDGTGSGLWIKIWNNVRSDPCSGCTLTWREQTFMNWNDDPPYLLRIMAYTKEDAANGVEFEPQLTITGVSHGETITINSTTDGEAGYSRTVDEGMVERERRGVLERQGFNPDATDVALRAYGQGDNCWSSIEALKDGTFVAKYHLLKTEIDADACGMSGYTEEEKRTITDGRWSVLEDGSSLVFSGTESGEASSDNGYGATKTSITARTAKFVGSLRGDTLDIAPESEDTKPVLTPTMGVKLNAI
eukprot:TRINITY_DN81925_c0_g1_i1.p1 TRINITY_DN81925_c0_g1~~TRINITY_DN81925_c0_g1_i1.p1  ORF type:complete len:267 (+),score=33.16 TRINITY_DN81925_c0_g1_i1:45-803(+)